ncbi:hypothetical protein AB833_15920 [Chromatiales bacterium (ex Bugula neritina AB1)]|nr:hypothetical protein AB833_15920 [Chromatiales bacterium (ex Bugula neritina AB1)]
MLKYLNFPLLCALLCSGFNVNALADVAKGEKLYRQCQGCHSIGPEAANGFGPQLNGVFERGPGGADKFDYSPAFDRAVRQGMRWTDVSLDEFLKAPRNYIPDTRMAFPGVKNKEDRQEIIAYLKLVGLDGELPETAKQKARRLRLTPRKLAAETEIPAHGVLHLGRPALPEEVVAWDIDIRPDGKGLPEGSGSVEYGTEVYEAGCAACHGIFGEGLGRWPVLAGGHDTLTDERPEKTIGSYWPYLSTVFDYIRRAMPFGNARSLSDDDIYAVTAYLLYLNDQVDEDFVLTSENFNSIRLPNEANFIADNRQSEEAVASAGEPCMSNCFPEPAVVTERARILDVTPDKDSDEDSSTIID